MTAHKVVVALYVAGMPLAMRSLLQAIGRGNPSVNFRGDKRSNATHESTADPEARLATKGNGQTSKMSYSGHVLMENRNGLCVDIRVVPPSGYAERDEALEMIRRLRRRGFAPQTVGADRAYDVGDFPHKVRDLGIKPHLAVNVHRPPGSPARRVARGVGYETSQRIRKRVEVSDFSHVLRHAEPGRRALGLVYDRRSRA
jgi:hypothetical protein